MCERGAATVEKLEYLVSKGSSVNARGGSGFTPLQFLFVEQKPNWKEVGEFLVSKGAQINCSGGLGNNNLLHTVCVTGRASFEQAVWLVEKGIDINARDSLGKTALHWAKHYNKRMSFHNEDIIKFLESKGAIDDSPQSSGFGFF